MAASLAHVCAMMGDAGQCARFYQDMGLTTLSKVALKLEEFTKTSAKRCKEKYLDEANHGLEGAEQALGELSEEQFLPLLCCIFTCQMDSCNSSSLFLRLEKMVLKMSQIRPCLVTQQREQLLMSILENKEVLNIRNLQAVCMYLEGSHSGRMYFTQHLPALLSKVSVTLSEVVYEHVSQSTEQAHLAVKLCLQLFREEAENVSPFIWDSAHIPNPLESILESLLQIIIKQKFSRDVRMLAGTAVASLANTGPVVESAAKDAMNLVQQITNGHSDAQFGMLHVSLRHPPVDELGLLALLRGLLTCGHEDLLTSVLHSPSQKMTVLESLLPAIASLCEGHTEQYYSFQVFCLWLQCVYKQTTALQKVRRKFLFADETDTISVVTRLLWIGAEIQVDGMPTLMLRCFQQFLHINRAVCQLSTLSEETVLKDVMEKIRGISWQARSRYPPLCALVPFMGSKKTLALYPLLPIHLFHCMATNFLCPPAAETYRQLVTLQREEWIQDGLTDEKELAKQWAQIWLLPLSNALSSTDCSLQNNTATHLIPCTLRTFAESFNLLTKQLNGCGPFQLRAWISIVRAKKAILGGVTGVEEKLQLCLESADDGVRLSAFIFLCSSPRSNQPPSLEELQLLKKYLPFNMGCDNPGFRQQLQATVRRALERLRDAAMSSLRKGRSQVENVSQTVDFTEWLFQLSVSSLSPAGNYQRRCSALLSLCSLLECCTDCWSPEKKKGQPPQDVSLLLQFAQQSGCWSFQSAHSMHALLGCMQDSTNEIREMASDLLVRFFLPTPGSVTISLFELGQKYLYSPRVSLAEVGALFMKTLLQRPDASLLLSENVPLSPLELVTYLTKMLQDHYCCAQENLLSAASAKPMHGVLCALRLCLLEVPSVSLSLSQPDLAPTWYSLLLELLGLLQEITSFILGMLHKTWKEEQTGIAAPSFEDMGNAVRALIAHGKGQEGVQGDILLSEEHSLIMTCFWVSLKEIGMFLGPLVEKLLSSSPIIPLSAVQGSMAAYHDIFMRCRHWGAVDGCNAGFTRLCSALLHHKDPKLRDLPNEMMQQALLVAQSQTSLSVTRRAAGFPVLLQCILSAEGSQHPLLETCVLSLLILAKKPLSTNWDQTRDLPQVTAVHALQSMLRSASLRSTLLHHAVPMMSLALVNLSSPCWAMRNAALQLFTALTVGMLELSRSDTDSSVQSTLHVGVLLRRFPGLLEVLLQELQMARKRKKMLHPSLHPILTLLAKLQPGGDIDASCLIEPLLELRENPIYAVRVVAARALVPVVQEKDCCNLLLQLILDLPQRNERVSHNMLHGQLQQIYALLSSVQKRNCFSECTRQEVVQHLLPVFWLMSPVQKCPLIRHAFLDVLSLLSPHCGEDFARQVQAAVCKELSAKEPFTQVGTEAYHEACVRYLCNEASSALGHKASSYVCQLLLEGDTAVLKWLNGQQLGDIPTALGHSLRDILENTLCKMLREDRTSNLGVCLESFVHLHRVGPSLAVDHSPHTKNSDCIDVLLHLLESRKGGPQLQGYALSTLSLLLAHGQVLDDHSLVSRWLSVLTACSDPAISCEKLRLAAADALQLAGVDLVRLALEYDTSELAQLAVRTILCAVNLLQDEDRGVRELATRFAVAALNRPPETTFHTDWAIVCLLELLRNSFWGYEETFLVLINQLHSCDLCTALCSLHERSVALYEEDEPNMFADTNFLSSLLHSFLYDLMNVMSSTVSLCAVLLQWVQSTIIMLKEKLKEYHSWTNQHGARCVSWLAASGCSRVHSAVSGLLVRGELLLRAHEILNQVGTPITLGSLREELVQLKEELSLHGLGHSTMKIQLGLSWRHCTTATELKN